MRKVIPQVKKIINQSYEEAKFFNDVKIRPEHLISSILKEENFTTKLFKKFNTKIKNILIDLEKLNRENLTPRVEQIYNTIPLSEESKNLLIKSDEECGKLGEEYIAPIHIVLSAIKSITTIKTIFENNGLHYDLIFKNYQKIKDMAYFESDENEESSKPKNKRHGGTSSKTPILDNFSKDITKLAEEGKLDPIIGRDKEIQRIAQILCRRKKNNPVLIGPAGGGKTSLVDGLAQKIKDGKAPRFLQNKRILSLDMSSVVAGTKYRGQFEERMKGILDELVGNKEVILFIDELHTIVGAGNSQGNLDASNIFKPALSRGEIQIIGATTLDEFRSNIEKDAALTRRFQQVMINPPTAEETLNILKNIKSKYEEFHKVRYTDDSLNECVRLAERYITDREFPDKAIDILDEAGAMAQINTKPSKEILEIESKLSKIKEEKINVVKSQKYEEAARLRDEEKHLKERLEESKKIWELDISKRKSLVDDGVIAEIVSMMTSIPLNKLSLKENKKLLDLEKLLDNKVIGQTEAIEKIAKALRRSRVGIKNPNKPMATFLFLGPTGVGKTFLAKTLSEHVFGSEESLIRVDMSEFQEKFNISRLIGSPPGYVGHEDGGQLTEKVRRRPYSVVLFDEVEKAHPDVFNLLLQMLDEGHMTDSLGRKVNFKNCLVILTSNIGIRQLEDFGVGVGFKTKSKTESVEIERKSVIEKELKKKFAPEFINRLDDIIMFNSLNSDDLKKIVDLELINIEQRIIEIGYKIKFNKNVKEFLSEKGYDDKFGARPLNRCIQKYIEDVIAEEILKGHIKEGQTIELTVDKENDTIIVKQ
jgi:ATP-dependent Clp protease ATP-binding subunit ClpC